MPVRQLLLLASAALGFGYAQAPTPAVPDSVSIEANIPYGPYKETVLDVIQPKAPRKGKRPGVICIHGGGWLEGTKEEYVSFWLPYIERGFVVANVEYRLGGVAKAPAAVSDVLNAARWFRKNAKRYNVDPKRIVVTGDSAGGHLALMVGMTPKIANLGPPATVAAVINLYGITDVADQLSGPNMRRYTVAWVPDQPGRLELARRISPMTYVRKNVPPILTIHGENDPSVPYEHGVSLTKALRAKGADAEMIGVPQGKHGFPPEKMAQLYQEIFAFLERRGVLR